jgi:hypothetical protein
MHRLTNEAIQIRPTLHKQPEERESHHQKKPSFGDVGSRVRDYPHYNWQPVCNLSCPYDYMKCSRQCFPFSLHPPLLESDVYFLFVTIPTRTLISICRNDRLPIVRLPLRLVMVTRLTRNLLRARTRTSSPIPLPARRRSDLPRRRVTVPQ